MAPDLAVLLEMREAAEEADFVTCRSMTRFAREARERARALTPARRRDALAALDDLAAVVATREVALVADLSGRVRRGLRGAALVEACTTIAGPIEAEHLGDTPFDALLERLLGTDGRFDGTPAREEGLIHYDPSPASVVVALYEAGYFAAGERFVDIGSGIGRVTVLGALLGQGEVVGLELDASLVVVADEAARSLGSPARHVAGDARAFAFRGFTRAFLGAPFVGPVLDAVLQRLHEAAVPELASWGPSTPQIARNEGFRALDPARIGPFDVARFARAGGLP